MNWKSEKPEKKEKDCHHLHSHPLKVIKDSNNTVDKEGLVNNPESSQSLASTLATTHKFETDNSPLMVPADKSSTTTVDEKFHPANLSNCNQQKNDCHGSDQTIDSSLKQCCPLLTGLRLSQTSSGNDCETSVHKSNAERNTGRDTFVNDDAAAVRVQIKVERKTKTKINKRATRKMTKKSYRQDGKKKYATIQLDISLVNSEQSEEELTNGKDEIKSKKVNAKHFVKLAGKRMWKGVRVSCNFLWSGLILYAKPFGSTEMNCAKVWEDKLECEETNQYPDHSDDEKLNRKLLNRGA